MSATVFTTCEVVLCDIPALTFDRVFDEETGFDELRVVASASAGSGGPGGDA
jgi:predicted DNA-binding protein with PD1-like motif